MLKFILFLIISITIGVFLQRSSPEFSFTYNAILIKIPTWQVIACILLIIILQNYLIKIAFNNWLQNRRSNKAINYIKTAFSYLISDNISEVIKLLPILKKHQIYNQFDYQQLEFKIHTERFEQIADLESIDSALSFFKHAPKNLKQDLQFILSYINCLLKFKSYDLAENIIKITLSKNINNFNNNLDFNNNFNNNILNLIKLYGLINSSNIKQQIKTAETWNNKYPNNFTLLLTLGRLCTNEGLLGKAKNYLEQAVQLQPDPVGYAELGKLTKLLDKQNNLI